jgi:hypothetical protein
MATDEEKYETFKRMDMPLLADHYAKKINRNSGGGPSAVMSSGGGGKGGKPSIDPRTDANQAIIQKSQNDGGYGYYTNMGRYVPFHVDIRDGGGMNTSGNYFKGAGPLSTALNVAKVRPAGPAREKVDGEYVIPREQIGYRDSTDWTDRGGPQASGGKYEGGGQVSAIFNMIDTLGGATIPERQEYIYDAAGKYQPRTKKKEILKVLMGG